MCRMPRSVSDSIFRGVLTMVCLYSDTWFSIFFPRFTGSARLYFATRTIMNTRCGTWIHLVFAAIQPSHQFLRTRARTICMHRHPDADNRYGNHVLVDRSTATADTHIPSHHEKSYAVLQCAWIVMRNRGGTLASEADWTTIRWSYPLVTSKSSIQRCYWRRKSDDKYF